MWFKKSYEDKLYAALTRQKRDLDKKWQDQEDRMNEIHTQAINLLKQEHSAEIRVLKDEIRAWESKKKDMENRDYKNKLQIKVNHDIANRVTIKAREASNVLVKVVEEFAGIFDEAADHNNNLKKIENKTL